MGVIKHFDFLLKQRSLQIIMINSDYAMCQILLNIWIFQATIISIQTDLNLHDCNHYV